MAFDAYLEIIGIDGESLRRGYENQIEVLSFSFGASNPPTVSRGQAVGSGVGLSDFTFLKRLDAASSDLFLACCTGRRLEKVTCSLQRGGGIADAPFMRYVFEDVFVSSIQWSGSSGGDDVPTESVSIAFARVTLQYATTHAKGHMTPGRQGVWALRRGSAE